MESEEIYLIRLGSLLHDIGKFWQRTKDTRDTHQELSARFIESYLSNLPSNKKLADSVREHHSQKPSSKIGMIIKRADQLSAGEREGDVIKDVPTEPMESIFSKIEIEDDGKVEPHYYHLTPLELDEDRVFPLKAKGRANTGTAQYLALWEKRGFIEEFKQIPQNDREALFDSLYHLLQKYTSFMPSAVYASVPDIALFDHLKTTCAIADCIYKMEGKEQFLLIGGDVSGIQKFIYTISSRGAAKSLRGRSFYLQLLSESLAKYIIRRLDLSIANILFCGGGHFYILAPMSSESALIKLRKEISEKLLEIHKGELYLCLDWLRLGREELMRGEFSKVWNALGRRVGEKKKMKFEEILRERHKQIFELEEGGGRERCEACGHELFEGELAQEAMKCSFCNSLETLATHIANAKWMVELYNVDETLEEDTWEWALAKFGFSYRFSLSGIESIEFDKVSVFRLNSTDFLKVNINEIKRPVALGFKFLANKTPRKEGRIKNFDEIADDSRGIKRWGILRMDVDDLGRIFGEGLGKDATISGISTLSSMLSLYFNGWVEKICKSYENVYCIYSGGDDLFVVGSWDLLPDLGMKIYDDFRRFTCHHPKITLSAGIIIVPDKKYPLYKAGDLAKVEEDRAKDLPGKDGVAFLGKAVKWRVFKEEIVPLKDEVLSLIDGGMSRAFIQKLYAIYSEYCKETKKGGVIKARHDDRYGRWRWLLAYLIARSIEQNKGRREELEKLQKDVRTWIEHLPVAVRWGELLTRKGGIE